MSWWYIFRKSFVLRDTRQRSEEFERTFWSGPDMNQLFQSIVSGRRANGSMERIFEAGSASSSSCAGRPVCRSPW